MSAIASRHNESHHFNSNHIVSSKESTWIIKSSDKHHENTVVKESEKFPVKCQL